MKSNITTLITEIKEAVSTYKSLIWIYTTEEKEVEALIYNSITELSRATSVYTTSLTSPITELTIQQDMITYDDSDDNGYGFDAIINMINEDIENQETSKAYILKDYHQVLSNPSYIRKLKDVCMTNLTTYRPIIIISSSKDIPIELLNKTAIIDYTLPSLNDIIELLNSYTTTIKDLKLNTQGLEYLATKLVCFTRQEIIDLLNLSMYRHDAIDLDIIKEYKTKLIQQTGVLDIEDTSDITLDTLGGNDNFKSWIKELQYLNTPEAKEFGIIQPKGHVSLGISGTAKTASTKAIANLLDVPMLKLNTSKIFDKHVGSSERNIEKAFNIISSYSPCLLLIDEVEKALSGTTNSESDGGTSLRVFARILSFLEEDNGVYVVMTANDVSKLPPELTRAGRVDAIFYFSMPTLEERRSIFKIQFKKYKIEYTVSDEILELTEGYTGAEIEQIVKAAKKKHFVSLIAEQTNTSFNEEYIIKALEEVIPISKSSKEKINALEMWARNRVLYASSEKQPKTIINKTNKFKLE